MLCGSLSGRGFVAEGICVYEVFKERNTVPQGVVGSAPVGSPKTEERELQMVGDEMNLRAGD